jgi:hypothetical protein
MRVATVAKCDMTRLDSMVAELKARYERLAQAAEAAHADYVQLHGARQLECDHGSVGRYTAGLPPHG